MMQRISVRRMRTIIPAALVSVLFATMHSYEKKQETNETVVEGKYNVVYQQSTPEIYNTWAKDPEGTYDDVIPAVAATSVAAVLAERLLDATKEYIVLDAGCGTGKLMEACRDVLQGKVNLTVDGLDYSPGMLEVARRKGLYRRLMQGDLKKPLSQLPDGEYGAVMSSGTFLQGHVGPEAIPELCRVLSKGGVMVFSVRPAFFEQTRDQWMTALQSNAMHDIAVKMMPYAPGRDGAGPMMAPIVSCRKKERD